MAFVDEITITARAGRGGDGVVRWRREKFVPKGGPAGGNGGHGGDVYFEGVEDLGALARYRSHPEFRAGDGSPGGSAKKTGRRGNDVVIQVPVGSVIEDCDRGIRYEIVEVGQRIKVLHGGEGGRGNAAFVSSTNQAPDYATPGQEGEWGQFRIILKLIADVGFVGLPNAGKSTLLNALTNAESRVGAYPFTTLEPHLGALRCPRLQRNLILADLPGLIEGAAAGRGLGHRFLKHVERTRLLLHVISPVRDSIEKQYKIVKQELASFNSALLRLPKALVITHRDELSGREVQQLRQLVRASTALDVEEVFFTSPLLPHTIDEVRAFLCNRVGALLAHRQPSPHSSSHEKDG